MTGTRRKTARPAEIVREYGPFAEKVGGVTHDGHRVWAATVSVLYPTE